MLSTVEVTEPTQRYQPPGTIIDGTDRTPGKGIGHLIAFDGQGNLLDDVQVGDGANIYHPGGLDYDGRALWTAVAEYRPNKPSIIYRVDPLSLTAREVLRTPDHIGGIVHDTLRDRVLGLNWGSRTAYEWKLTARGGASDRHDGQPEPLRRLPGLQVPGQAARLPRTRRCCAAASPACAIPGPTGSPSATTSAASRSWT